MALPVDIGPIVSLFTDVEGSTRLWEESPQRMRLALAQHDALAREAVERHRGRVVKMIGDGVHGAFDDPLDAVCAALHLQHALADPAATGGVALRARCGIHAGVVEARMLHLAMHRTPADETILMARIDRARVALGAGFDAAAAEGTSLDYDQALDELTGWLEAHAAQRAQVPG